MVVGVLTLELLLQEADSLKGKRKVLKSLLERLKHRFNISVAEVGRQDNWKYSTVGISAVSGDMAHMQRVLASVVRFVENHNGVEVLDVHEELL
ncbi:DUF503 domain-containing protein [Desulfoscipio geothermicus]|uniref:DUF503 domain-containing protein n=1 Tax=Desulfoscipio geothermicus DSM 3669 TaxID=1121426 RepID=A0A1I6EJF1_9FIRM|nr:DUF503 domain-containing protein [Desulfoscipio geothermicus]SFR17879.1 hypothetical protein SAMN05660706_1509 [Desulfoscipio geothermicus DSM 3669]